MSKTLVCMMGLPRSGKSTVARVLSKQLSAPVVNRDSIRLALHGQRYQQLAEPMIRAIAGVMVRSLFAYHDTVIVDETNIRLSTREFWREIDPNAAFLYVTTPKEICLERARATNDEEIQPVIERMSDALEPLVMTEMRFCVCEMPTVYAQLQEAIGAKGENHAEG